MSWHFSRALVGAFWAENCSDGAPSAQLNATPTPQAYLSPDRMTAFSRLSRFGMTFAPLTDALGADVLTWFLADFHARTSAPLERAQESTEHARECGRTWHESLARYDHASRSWKTPQCSLLAGLDVFSETWPRWGTMRAGGCWAQSMPAHLTEENVFGLSLPTPTATANMDSPSMQKWPSHRNLWPTHRTTGLDGGSNSRNAAKARGMWPTPLASDGSKGGPNQRGSSGDLRLSSAVAERERERRHHQWPTPQTSEAKSDTLNLANRQQKGKQIMLCHAVRMWPTPKARDWKDGTCKGPDGWTGDLGKAVEPNAAGGSLNPQWVEWLMNWPVGWTDLQNDCTHESEYWKAASATTVSGDRLREMWFNREAGAPSQRQEPAEQRGGECGGALFAVPPEGTQADRPDRVHSVRSDVSTKTITPCEIMRKFELQQDSRETISRVAVGVAARVDRLRCLGNGQVPAVVRLAWETLTS